MKTNYFLKSVLISIAFVNITSAANSITPTNSITEEAVTYMSDCVPLKE